MRRRDVVGSAFAIVMPVILAAAPPLFAQAAQPFAARLGWVPISGAERGDVAGQGSAKASLSGSRLSIAGAFDGLPAPATAARLHQGVATGARGPAIAELDVTHAQRGEIEGSVDLTAGQLAALLAGYVYIQVHADGKGVPEDNSVLWGWLLPDRE